MEGMSKGAAPCRCLLADAMPEMAAAVADYVASLPEETRAAEETRQARLAECTRCASLLDGTCALCGCYVEARTAKRRTRCPAVPPRWREA